MTLPATDAARQLKKEDRKEGGGGQEREGDLPGKTQADRGSPERCNQAGPTRLPDGKI